MKLQFACFDRPNYYGGPIVKARRLLPELCRRGHEVHCLLFYQGDHAPSAGFLEERGVHCRLRPFDDYTERHVEWTLRRVADVQPDVFIPNLLVACFYAARWVREAGIPTVAVHYSDDAFNWAVVDEFVSGDPAWAVSGMVCYSEHLRRETERRSPARTRLCTIPSGVYVSDQSSPLNSPPKLVYVGRLEQEQKRIHDVVDALALALRANPGMTATLIGSGGELQAVRDRIAGLDMLDRIIPAGAVSGEEIQDVLREFHTIVLLSDYEGTPGALLDGMAAGLVPVCLDIPGGCGTW